MTQCERLSDRIPDVALGRSTWSTEEQAHLDACPDCRAEWELVARTSRLGSSLPALTSPEVMTAALLGRLSRERMAMKARRRNWLAVGLAAAAAILIVVRIPRTPSGAPITSTPAPPAGIATRPISPPAPTTPSDSHSPVPSNGATGAVVSLPELDGLPDAELETILGALDESATLPSFDGTGFDQPDDHELEQALEAWEG